MHVGKIQEALDQYLKSQTFNGKGRSFSSDKIDVGDFVSTDQFVCKNSGSLPTVYGRDSSDRFFQGGTIYKDATSSLVWFENQVSLGSNETVMGKSRFDQWLWYQDASEVSHYHGNNGIFTTAEYKHDCK